MSRNPSSDDNPYLSLPKNPNQKRRARHHDYRRPARYMLTLNKAPYIPTLSVIRGSLTAEGPASPDFPHAVPLDAGLAVCEALRRWQSQYPQITVDRYVIMPDHVHLCVNVTSYLEVGLSRAVSNFMGKCTRVFHDSIHSPEDDSEMLSFFMKGYNDRIAYSDEQYTRQLDYILDNPRRLLLKRSHPDLFFKRWTVTVGNVEYHAIGNIFLLKNPEIVQVRFSRRYTEEQWKSELLKYAAVIENGGVLVSPFIHPNEKDVRSRAIDDGGNIIRICENGFSERFSPGVAEMNLLGCGRLLLIAPSHYENRRQDMKYTRAQALNAVAAGFAGISADCRTRFRPDR